MRLQYLDGQKSWQGAARREGVPPSVQPAWTKPDLGKGMLSSVEQAFVGRDERRAPLKTPAWEASVRIKQARSQKKCHRHNFCRYKDTKEQYP